MPKFKIGDWVWITHTANRQLFKITARQGTYYGYQTVGESG